MALLPPSPNGQPPGNSFWNDWYEKLRTIINTGAVSIAWTNITGKPTTLAGYGISDGTILSNSAGLAAAVSDETGTGVVVFNTNPNLINPVLGNATGTSVTVSGVVSAGGSSGFQSTTFVSNAQNPIWRFGNALGYGLSYFQGTAGTGSVDTIGMHFGTASAAGSLFRFIGNGNFEITGALTVNSAVLIRSTTTLTNGAAGAVGTLNNAPTAGNPTKWIPINDNGTTRYVPAW